MKRNVLNWLAGEVPSARHALLLTHNISFLFVQNVLLPKLRAAGDPRITIFADAGCATSSWRQDQSLINGLGLQYRVVPVDLGPWRRFHPKALLLADHSRAALAIGSGNLTHGGMGANREAWVFGTTDDDGAGRIAALRDYLMGLIEGLPLNDTLRDTADAIFDPKQSWVVDLPPPAGLATAPNSRAILDQLAWAAGPVRSVTVLAPYFDDRAEALTEIALRFQAPVTALLQPGHVGLWAKAAETLPPGISLKAVEDPSEKPAFIHAKVIALHRETDVLLAVGSANCSRAALLSGSDAGNAELVAWSIEPPEQVAALLDDLRISNQAPPLPQTRPSDDWDEVAPPAFRILAARHEADELQVAFPPVPAIRSLEAIGEGVWPTQAFDAAGGRARFMVPIRLRTLRLRATLPDGVMVETPPSWVDDEASLGAPATLRRVFKRLEESGGSLPGARGYEALLDVFHEYLRDPEAATRRVQFRNPDGPHSAYNPADVFDDGFGSKALVSHGVAGRGRGPSSVLSAIEMLFGLQGRSQPRQPTGDDAAADQDDASDPGDAVAEEMLDGDVLAPREQATDPRLSAAVARAASRIEKALLEPAFVSARSPALLSADLALAAIILVMGLSAGHLDRETYRQATRRLWSGLFFGRGGRAGAIPARISGEGDEAAFKAEFCTSRLAAALCLWCCTEWTADDPDSGWFRLSATVLQARLPSLFASGEPDDILNGLGDLAEVLLPQNERTACTLIWRDVVRAGQALKLLEAGLAGGDTALFRQAVQGGALTPSDLVWVGQSLAFPVAATRRDAATHVRVTGKDKPFRGDFVFPVRALLGAGVLDLLPAAMPEIENLITALENGIRVDLAQVA